MIFAQPEYLNLLWGLPLLALALWGDLRRRRRRLESMVRHPLLLLMAPHLSWPKAVLRRLLLTGFFLFGILAAAEPQWGVRLQTAERRGVDIIAALDVSFSMNAEDVAPNRIEKAKGEIVRLLEKTESDRIGLIFFSGKAGLQCPLTLDYSAVRLLLAEAETGMAEGPGTSLAAAIETAAAAFIEKERKHKALLLFTDGEDLSGEIKPAIEKAKAAGVLIYAIGIGTSRGAPIPVRNSAGDVLEYRRDPEGGVVLSRLDEGSLKEIAAATGGRYFRASTQESEIGALAEALSRLEKKKMDSRMGQSREERFQIPLALAAVFLVLYCAIGERRANGAKWFRSIRS